MIRLVGLAEILDIHLLELARAENEILHGDLVAKRLTDLRDTKRQFAMRRLKNRLPININILTALAFQINNSRSHPRPGQDGSSRAD